MLVDNRLDEPNEGTAVQQGATSKGQLVVVATPLGNLGDISARALELLAKADVVYCEDTRRSSTLFSANDIPVHGRLRALHEHNEASLCDQVVAEVLEGKVVVLVSDAGTPGISDPGSRVVAAVADAGLVVTTAPGPSAVVAALSISGLSSERFIMEGFVARKAGERRVMFELWRHETRTVVFYESPQRLAATLHEMTEWFAERRCCVARELTKLHEEVVRGSVAELSELFASRDVLGEIVVVLEGTNDVTTVSDDEVRDALRAQLSQGASTRDAVTHVEETLGVPHRVVYQMALELRASDNG
jgi:16S rRNA (cytidine1402-2'-O)-methyltransferase